MNRQKGFTLVELMIVLAIIAIIAAFAVPNLIRSRMGANETGAVGSLRTLMTAEGVYMNEHRIYGTMEELLADDLIDSSIAGGKKAGYYYGELHSDYSDFAYCFGACPMDDGRSGMKEFMVTQKGTIYEAVLDSSQTSADIHWTTAEHPGFYTDPENHSDIWTPIQE